MQETDLLATIQQQQKRVEELEAALRKSEQDRQTLSKQLEDLRSSSLADVRDSKSALQMINCSFLLQYSYSIPNYCSG